MALAMIALLIGAAGGYTVFLAWGHEDGERQRVIAGTIAGVAAVAALALWFTRPGLKDIDQRVAAAIAEEAGETAGNPSVAQGGDAKLTCTLVPERSRFTGTPAESVEFDWTQDGCVNGRTQYGFRAGEWSRVFVPNEDPAVSINSYDPENQTYQTDRYLLTASRMATAREKRGAYTAPKCATDDAAAKLGDLQSAVTGELPSRPNERLVYTCEAKSSDD